MTHSGTAMGVVLLASTIPRLIFLLIGGIAADRLPRRLIILWSDGGRGVIVLLISIIGFMGYLQFWQLIVESLIFGVVDGFFNPAIMAITPGLVEKDDLSSANALTSFSGTMAQLFGPLLIALFTPMGAFFADALSFIISVAFLLTVRIPERHVTMQAEMAESPLMLWSESLRTRRLRLLKWLRGLLSLWPKQKKRQQSREGSEELWRMSRKGWSTFVARPGSG